MSVDDEPDLPVRQRSIYETALDDFAHGFGARRIWFTMALTDLRRRYRRTTLGPLWTTVSLAIFILTLGILYTRLWEIDPAQYIPYLTCGMICWTFFATSVSESGSVFVNVEGLMKQTTIPYSTHVLSLIMRNLLIFAHHLIVYALVALFYGIPIGWAMLLVIPGLILMMIVTAEIALLIGLASARYRDIQQVIASLLQIALFVTPILYSSSQLKGRAAFVSELNPLYHLINVIRAPLLGEVPTMLNWLVTLGMATIGAAIAFAVFARQRRKLIFWV